MVASSQVLLIIIGFWLALTYIAGRFDLQKYNLFISSGFLIWNSEKMTEMLSKPRSALFQKFQKLSVYLMLTLFYALPLIFLVNYIRSYFAPAAPIFEGNPLQVFNFTVILLVLPAVFVVGSVYQLVKGMAMSSSGQELESSGLLLLGVILLFYSRGSQKIKDLNASKQLKIIASPFMAMLLMLLLLYPLAYYNPSIISPIYHESTGALVVNISADPAQEKGFAVGDIITAIKTVDRATVIDEIEISSKVDFYSTLRNIDPGTEFIIVLGDDEDQINIIGSESSEDGRVVGGTYIGLDVVDYREPKIGWLSPMLPFILVTILSWMINIALLFALYNVLPVPMGDGEELLKILMGKISGRPLALRGIQVLYLVLFLLNFFLQ